LRLSSQLKILLDQVDEAVEDFDECIRLRPDSALAQAQKCFALYRQAYTGNNPSQVQTAMDGFEDVIRKFPKCAEGYALYAQTHTLNSNRVHTDTAIPFTTLCRIILGQTRKEKQGGWKGRMAGMVEPTGRTKGR
ncbi:hypothetical protein CHARACLAT_016359, partial [Characodon lateralis]|nr:hypothetical protein [Characodon lateralis]